jgi:lipopolysaccharide/colanic/teichoic acid biosynthesis glycosyltransferase
VRRLVDILIGLVTGTALSPFALLIAVGIRCSCGSPVLFRQKRAGRYGRVFVIYKFRTMRPPAHPREPDIERLTPVGRFLRASSLDELPQLWNIIRGDMSLIGPRPTLPEQVVHYSPRQRGRLAVRPGLTGWAQVNGRNALSWPERIELDLWYIANRSLLLDLRITALTVLGLIRPRGIVGANGENPGFPVGSSVTAPERAPAADPEARWPAGAPPTGVHGSRDEADGSSARERSAVRTPVNGNYKEVGR